MAMGRSLLLFAAGLLVGLFLLIGGLFLAAPAMAVEPICPGGSSPRSDIVLCVDFDTLTNCTTGQEDQCWIDNGYNDANNGHRTLTPGPYGWTIAKDGGAVGSGYARIRPRPGSVAGRGAYFEPPPGFSPKASAFNIRYYVRYSRGYTSFYSGHEGSMDPFNTSATSCLGAGLTTIGSLRLQRSTFSGEAYYAIPSCANTLGSFFIPPNDQPFQLKNNRWYLIELHAVMDTACTDPTNAHGCNGVLDIFVDGARTHHYTDLNYGGSQGDAMHWGGFLDTGVSAYLHYGVPPWQGEIAVDNIVVSNNGTSIGPAPGENSRGTADASSPYATSPLTYEAWLGRRVSSDCTTGGFLGLYNIVRYRTFAAATIQSAITHGLYTNGCTVLISQIAGLQAAELFPPGALITVTDAISSSDCTVGGGSLTHNCKYNGIIWVATTDTDAALKINITSNSDGSGAYWENSGAALAWPQWASYGWIYLPSSNNYTTTNLALTGFAATFSNANSGYVALTVNSGNWAINQKDTGGNRSIVATSTAVTFDTWHEYELIIWNDNTVSLMIDRQRLLTKAVLPRSSAWAFRAGSPAPYTVIGVIDFQGTPPFVVYYDDNTVTTVSAWSCDGWGPASCPFSASASTRPAAPSGLTVR